METLSTLGPWIYPLAGVGLCLLAASVRAGVVVASMEESLPASGAPHHAVLAWGVLGVVVGLLGTVIGFGRVAIAARAAAGSDLEELEAMLALMWDGVLVIVTPVTMGLWLFTSALIVWLGLDVWMKRRLR